MKLFGLGGSHSEVPSDMDVLAAQLRRLASQVERGEISTVIATVIRRDGSVERIGERSGATEKA